ncbi:MAG TPA: SUMF1/EgtB/PvdO family nonheme iron enzyme [Pirellulales bacterium]|nr:SUMF1/EgtB/PvdO family nonheme iron enzyme [Pirellulales bacterium]
MRPYTEVIANTTVHFDLVPIPGGKFSMGSPADEPGHRADESPRHEVEVAPFWMGKHEVTWDEFDTWSFALDAKRRKAFKVAPSDLEAKADAVTRPTLPYREMSFDMGKVGCPAICMTQLAAKTYCQWLSEKTGRYYRLPTEAEWEFACRAGSDAAYSFGNDASQIDDFAWHRGNSQDRYHPVGQKKPNSFGLYDMHGNVAEWTLDAFTAAGYGQPAGVAVNPVALPNSVYPQTVRGGSWIDPVDRLRSAARLGSDRSWKRRDPQLPQSIWYFTDAPFVGFRIVRPLTEPPEAEKARLFDAGNEE